MGSPAGMKAERAGQPPLRLGIDCQPSYIPKCANPGPHALSACGPSTCSCDQEANGL